MEHIKTVVDWFFSSQTDVRRPKTSCLKFRKVLGVNQYRDPLTPAPRKVGERTCFEKNNPLATAGGSKDRPPHTHVTPAVDMTPPSFPK